MHISNISYRFAWFIPCSPSSVKAEAIGQIVSVIAGIAEQQSATAGEVTQAVEVMSQSILASEKETRQIQTASAGMEEMAGELQSASAWFKG